MTSKLKCPVCNVPLTECGDLLFCPNDHCAWAGNAELWQELVTKCNQLEIARKALEGIVKEHSSFADWVFKAVTMKGIADKALEQIEHKVKDNE